MGSTNSGKLICVGCATLLLAFAGCSSAPSAIQAVEVDAARLAAQLLAEYDKDSDGKLSPAELSAVPPLADSRRRFDRDRDGQISQEELQNGLERIFDPRAGLLSTICEVRRNGQPLPGAAVRFVPLPIFKDLLPAGTGTTDSSGTTLISIAAEEMPANAPKVQGFMRPGLYLVEVTHPDVKIPEKYNQQTTLGKEISVEQGLAGSITLDLRI